MTRILLALSIAALLLLFAAIGWIMHWLWHRRHHRAGGEDAHRAELTARLHAVEAARDAAERAHAAEFAEMAARLAACEAERDAALAALREAQGMAAQEEAFREAEIVEPR